MIQRLKLWHPFLLAMVPILNILTRNPGGSRLDDVAVVIGSALAVCGGFYAVVAVTLRPRAPRGLIPVVVLACVVLIYGKTLLGGLSRQLRGALLPAVLVTLLVLLLLGILWLARRPTALDRANTFCGLIGVLMVGWQGLQFAADLLRSRSAIRHSTLVQELARPIRSTREPSAPASAPRRDVYLIVLDEYANAGVLREQFQFDNRMFEDSLRHLGFTLPRVIRSNYVHTLLSLPSLLNFSHLTSLTDEIGAHSTDATLPNYLLEHNRTVRFFKSRGYRFLFFPSQWWPSTSRNREADWQFNPWHGFNPIRDATRSDLRRALLAGTAFALLKHDDGWDADYIRRSLVALEQVPRQPEPTFTFAHIVSPHWPYVFTANCGVVQQALLKGRAGKKRAYLEQLRCLNRMVLHTVTAILQRSAVPPIILLQGDHGTNSLRYSDARRAAAVSPAQARERFGAFGAYYLPAAGDTLVTDSVTVVNVLERVLRHYYGAVVQRSPDDLYLSLERTPYDFVQIDPQSFRPLPVAVSNQGRSGIVPRGGR